MRTCFSMLTVDDIIRHDSNLFKQIETDLTTFSVVALEFSRPLAVFHHANWRCEHHTWLITLFTWIITLINMTKCSVPFLLCLWRLRWFFLFFSNVPMVHFLGRSFRIFNFTMLNQNRFHDVIHSKTAHDCTAWMFFYFFYQCTDRALFQDHL